MLCEFCRTKRPGGLAGCLLELRESSLEPGFLARLMPFERAKDSSMIVIDTLRKHSQCNEQTAVRVYYVWRVSCQARDLAEVGRVEEERAGDL